MPCCFKAETGKRKEALKWIDRQRPLPLSFFSQEHLSRTFKKHTGFGFNEYLTLVRLQHAEQLLKGDEKMSISTIAYNCGFNDSNYFSDKFKKMYGTSPLKYSKAHAAEKSEDTGKIIRMDELPTA